MLQICLVSDLAVAVNVENELELEGYDVNMLKDNVTSDRNERVLIWFLSACKTVLVSLGSHIKLVDLFKVTFAVIHDMKVIFNTFLQLDNDLLRNRRSMHLVTSCFNSCDEIISYPLDL